ncbi:MAG TPA: NADP transhydrogenase subunit alpha, partial [Armatimonadetes bacterium]|nr:NADP transhydrogenase subunit alpha [Armatimonadota bacterium]
MLKSNPTFCVLGAGNGGRAMAAHLSLLGFRVTLYNRSLERIQPIQALGEIELIADESTEVPVGRAKLELVTTDIAAAIEDADILMVVTTANGHAYIAEQCAPYLRDGQIIVLHPGRTGGALEFYNILRKRGVEADVIVAEAETLIYACRSLNPGQVRIFHVKNAVPVAAIPAYRTPDVVKALRAAYPQFVPGDNVMKTGLSNIGAIFHPAITVLNAARIESAHGEFNYYTEGASPSVARVLEALDKERVAVAEALGFRVMSAREWMYVAYSIAGRNLYEVIQANPGYADIKAPRTLNHRYLHEDVPMSLVPIVSIGEMFGVDCPTMRSIIDLACIMNERDYWTEGRTVEKLGIYGLTLKEVRQLVL